MHPGGRISEFEISDASSVITQHNAKQKENLEAKLASVLLLERMRDKVPLQLGAADCL